jgi:F0F1-type ATP synthase assembly protein I
MLKDYSKYSGMAFEILALTLIMVFFGKKLDNWMHTDRPLMVAVMVCIGIIAYLIRLYYETQIKKKDAKK